MEIGLFYFSGTGNTEYMCQLLKKEMENPDIRVSLFKIEDLVKNGEKISLKKVDMMGICYPIYGGGSPALIKEWVKSLPQGEENPLFILETAADYIKFNHDASTRLISTLRRKKYNVFYDRILVMPSNWWIEYPRGLSRQFLEVLPQKISHTAQELKDKKKRLYKPAFWVKMITRPGKFFESRLGSPSFGRTLKTTESCTNCGLCIKICPRDNISSRNGKIAFGNQCQWCMRCIYSCPQGAIRPRVFKKCVHPNGYSLKEIQREESTEGMVDSTTKGFYSHFHSYLTHPEI